jgi:ribosomal-protein-alanine N-acetyltransferase
VILETERRDHAFGALGRARLVSLVYPGNGASARVAKKLGMRHERDVAIRGRLTRLYARSV